VNAAYAAHEGAENLSLNDWRDLELELERRLENEHQKRQRSKHSPYDLPHGRARMPNAGWGH
jgi:hypothetical protein